MDQQDSANAPVAPVAEQGAIAIDVNDMKDVSEQAEAPAAEESSTEENKAPDSAESNDEATETEGESEQSDKAEESSQDESKESDDSKGKNTAQNRIRSLANENRELRKTVETLNSQAYQPQTPQELTEQGMDPIQAQVEALRQESEVKDFNNRVAQINTDLNVEALQVINDYPVFDSNSKDYDKDFANKVNSLYQQSAGIETDPKTGLVLNANVLPYDFYKEMAELHTQAKVKGEVSGQRARDKQEASVDVSGRNKTKSSEESDPFMQGFNSV